MENNQEPQKLENLELIVPESVFDPFASELDEKLAKVKGILATEGNPSDEEIPVLKAYRLEFVKLRNVIDKKRKEKGKFYFDAKKAIDNKANELITTCEKAEEKIESKEKWREIAQEKEEAKLQAERVKELAQYVANPILVQHMELGQMTKEVWEFTRDGYKARFEAEQAAAKAKAEETERLRKENESLKAQIAKKETVEYGAVGSAVQDIKYGIAFKWLVVGDRLVIHPLPVGPSCWIPMSDIKKIIEENA